MGRNSRDYPSVLSAGFSKLEVEAELEGYQSNHGSLDAGFSLEKCKYLSMKFLSES